MNDGHALSLALAVWHIGLSEVLLLVALLVAVNGLDDLAVDILWLVMCCRQRKAQSIGLPPRSVGDVPSFAIIIPAWDESQVIGAMLRRLLASQDWPDWRVFVGLYPNDFKGLAAVAAVADPRLRMAIGPKPGPTTKADCLNSLWQAVLADEAARDKPYAAIVLHDAEDLVDPLELAVLASHLPGHAMVQLPVMPLPDKASPFVSGHYLDEFAESHGKDLLVRQWLGAALPSAGVGVAFDRTMLGRIAAANHGLPFDAESLTEDYELGHRIHGAGGQGVLVRVQLSGRLVATAEHFPATFEAAVRQKARWLTGIALAGWDRLGWQGGFANRWMLLRDRKAPIMALVTLAAYGLAFLIGVDWLLRAALPAAARLPPMAGEPLLTLLWVNWLMLCWRLVCRAAFAARLHGPMEGLLSAPRALVGNIINAAAALRALGRYGRALRHNQALAWDKTVHRFPKDG